MEPGHLSFVIGTWLASFQDSYAAGCFDWKKYREVYAPSIEALLVRPGMTVLVVVSESEASQALCVAFGAAQRFKEDPGIVQPTLHYIYVKRPYREFGLCSALLADLGIDPTADFRYTFHTKAWERVLQGPEPRDYLRRRFQKEGPRRTCMWHGRQDPTLARYEAPKREGRYVGGRKNAEERF